MEEVKEEEKLSPSEAEKKEKSLETFDVNRDALEQAIGLLSDTMYFTSHHLCGCKDEKALKEYLPNLLSALEQAMDALGDSFKAIQQLFPEQIKPLTNA
jgi:hypothetical protein